MRLVSPTLKHVVYPLLSLTGYLGRMAGDGLAVITYHGVRPRDYKVMDPALDGSLVRGESLRKQLHLLKSRYHVLSPQTVLHWCRGEEKLPPRSVLLTCDDGLRNTLTEMLPILQEVGFSCLFFVTEASLAQTASMLWYEELYLMLLAAKASTVEVPEIGFRRQASSWQERRMLWWELVKQLSQFDGPRRSEILASLRNRLGLAEKWAAQFSEDAARNSRFFMLKLSELRQLASAGMTIGAHTLSHPVLSHAPPELAWREISESRRRLEEALRQPVWALAYPFGDPASVTERELEMAERAGYQCAFMNAGGGFGTATPRFTLPRIHVTADMSVAEFEAHLSGFYRLFRQKFMGGGA
jgi:peptidoglycan/xylan/chitin deacetylase (PgdA/CDA1 family)